MELSQFVTETITQITKGITDAQAQTKDSGVLIVPSNSFGDVVRSDGYRQLQEISFQVAVSVSDKDAASGGISVMSVIKLGVQGEVETNNSRVTTISFKVPVAFPTTKV